MITGLRGTLEAISDDSLTVNIGPMSLEVFAPTSTIGSVGPVGGAVRLHTYLYIREEVLSLYGFGSLEERDLFVMLIGVSGVGPRLALSILSTMSPRELAGAIGAEDTTALTRVNGLGKKTAGRLILELKGKLEREWGEAAVSPRPDLDEIVAALSALGYAPAEARAALSGMNIDLATPLEEKIMLVLQGLGSG